MSAAEWLRMAINAPRSVPGVGAVWTWRVPRRPAAEEALKSCQREPAQSSADC
jgi:hypothetical protein